MSTTGYHDVPVVEHSPDYDGRTVPVGTADLVIERNEGSIEVFIKIPRGTKMYDFITNEDHKLLEVRFGAAVKNGQATR